MPLVKWIKQKRRNSVAANGAAENDRSDERLSERRRRSDAEGGLRPASPASSLGSEVSEAAVAPAAVDRQRSRSFDPAAVDPSVGSEAAAAALKIMVAHLSRSLPLSRSLLYSNAPACLLKVVTTGSAVVRKMWQPCGLVGASLRNDT